mmetsp:Transcript_8065/g.16829  ORF Transcript_8065/g.16829 Transcript_8065/m.16829 type:complete len:117 (+) Transcript_8065:726-1076(+)
MERAEANFTHSSYCSCRVAVFFGRHETLPLVIACRVFLQVPMMKSLSTLNFGGRANDKIIENDGGMGIFADQGFLEALGIGNSIPLSTRDHARWPKAQAIAVLLRQEFLFQNLFRS